VALRRRIKVNLGYAIPMAAVLSVWAALVFSVRRADAAQLPPIALPELIASYFAGAILAAVILALLHPLWGWMLGKVVVSMVAAFPVGFMLGLTVGEGLAIHDLLEIAAIFAILMGPACLLAVRWQR
jgi:hypothetical protein